MSRITYSSKSPYAKTKQTSWHIGQFNYRSIPASEEDSIIIVDRKYNNRPDLLSYYLYGDSEYWWIFYVRNRNVMTDPVFGLQTGMEIVVPSASHVKRTLGA